MDFAEKVPWPPWYVREKKGRTQPELNARMTPGDLLEPVSSTEITMEKSVLAISIKNFLGSFLDRLWPNKPFTLVYLSLCKNESSVTKRDTQVRLSPSEVMNILGGLFFAAAIFTVSARHRREWEFVDMIKASREVLLPFYKHEASACSRGVGFYRDPNDCHQYIRCVDDFSTGRRLSVFVGRCRPGLVFDENISSCNWPELAAPCSNAPEHFKDTPNKRNPSKQNPQVTQDNKIYEPDNWNKYQTQQHSSQDTKNQFVPGNQGFQEPQDRSKNAFQETEIQVQQSFEEGQKPQVQITEQEREPQVSEGFQEIPDSNVQEQVPITQQIREPVVSQEKDEPILQVQQNKDQVIQQQSKPVSENSKIREPVIQEKDDQVPVIQEKDDQVPEIEQIREPVVAEQVKQVSQDEQIREPVVAEQVKQVSQDEQIREPVVQEQTQAQKKPQIREPVIQEQTEQIKESVNEKQTQIEKKPQIREPVVEEQTETIKKPIHQQQNHQVEEVPIWQESDIQEKVHQSIQDQVNVQHPAIQDTQTNYAVQTENQKNTIKNNFQEKVPSGFFQEIPDNKPEHQSQWWVPENQNSQNIETFGTVQESNKYRGQEAPTTLEEAIKGKYFVRYELSCPKNFAYDDISSRCVSQKYASSCNQRYTPFPPRQDDEESSPTTEASEETSDNNKSSSGGDDIECVEEGYFRHPDDCNRFYRCVDFSHEGKEFVRYDFNCPEGLVFDESSSVCTWPNPSEPCESGSSGGSKGDNGSNENESEEPKEENSSTTSKSTAESGRSTTEKSTSRPRGTTSRPRGTTSRPSSTTSKPRGTTSNPGGTTNQEESSSTSKESTKQTGGSESDGCSQEGFFRNPEDCNKFYRCVDFSGEGQEFVRYDFDCPEGLVFDEANSVCNWPSESEPCDSDSGENNEGSKESSSSTTQKSRDSTTAKPRDSTTAKPRGSTTAKPRGSTTAKPRGSSTSKPRGSTTSKPRTTEAENPPTEEENSSVTESSTSRGEKSTSPGNRRTGSSSGECKEAGFFRNSDDCNKFYRCVDYNGDGQEFVKYDFSCPEGLVFDEDNSVCNWPDQSAPCEGSGSDKEDGNTKSEGNESSTSSTTSQEDNESTTTRRTTQRPQSTTTQRATKRPQSTTTQRTTKRPQSTTTRRTTKRPQSTTSASTSQQTTSSDQSTESPISSTTSGGSEEDSTKAEGGKGDKGECTEAGFFRNPDDCGKFYRCVDFNGDGQQFVRYDFDCPEGLYFDEVNSVCNWPEQTPGCESGAGSTKEGGNGGSTTTSQTDSTTQKQTTEQSTTKPTTQSTTLSSTQSTTQSPTQSTTQSGERTTSGKESECSEEGFFRCKDDCNKFYRCIDETGDGQQFTRYDFTCPDGLIFDERNKRCDFPSEELTCDTESTSTTSSTSSTTTSATPTTGTESTSVSTTTTSRTTTSKSSTTGSEESSKECTEEGYFRDPDDCSKYYRCIDEGDGTLTREEFSCAEDEVFDEEMRYCNRKDLAPPCGKECTEEGYFRDPDDCSKYYRCIDEGDGTLTREEFSCAEDEVFDEEMRYCNRKDLAPPCEEGSTSQTTSTTASGSSEESSTSSTTIGESVTEGSQNGCTQSGFFRCEEDCNRFYRCVDEDGNGNFKRYNFSCPDGLIFDEKNEKCDWPSDELTCDKESSTSSTGSSEPSSTSSTTSSETSSTSSTGSSEPSSTSSTTSSGTSSTSSSGECTEEGFFRNPDDCSKYYRCLDEGDGTLTKEDFSCEEDEVFDEEMRYCNRKDLAPPCDGDSSSTTESSSSSTQQSSSTTEPSSESTTESSESTTQSSSTTNQGEEQSTDGTTKGETKSGECEEEGFHRHPDDCNKFYRCVDFKGDGQSFTRYDFECPEGLVFDETNNVCNWPSSAPSCESSDKSTTSDDKGTTSSTQDSSSTTSTTQEDGSTSSTSTTGSTSMTTSSSTSSDTENTDSSTSSTGGTSPSDDSTTKSSGDKSSDDIECTEEGFFRNPDDCTKFYRCVDFAGTGESYVRYDFECPDDLVFDEVNSVCNWPSMTPGCEARSKDSDKSKSTTTGENDSSTSESTTSDTSQTSTTLEDNTRTTSGESTTDSGTTSSTTTNTTPVSTSTTGTDDFECEDEGFFKHPTDCKKYYECKRDEETGELVKIDCECPEGLVFDEDGWYCNAEELAPPCNDSSFKCEEEGFFRDPEDCTKYYRCNRTGSSFRRERFQCQEGTVFDEEGRYCNAPELSQPCDNSTTTTSSSETTSSSNQSTTPVSGTSSGSTSTTGSQTSTTSGTSSDQGDCTEEGYFRNPEDCTKYYQCTQNEDSGEFERKDFSCPDGRVFDEEVSYCNDPELSEEPCDTGNNTTSTTQGQTDSNSSSTTSSGTEETDSSSSGTTSGSDTESRKSGGDPDCTQEGFFRHPKDCNKFYRCVDFAGTGESYVRYDFDCPEGLHFDEVNSVCNWPTMTPRCTSESE
ncbi:UNVERIFIED_CONTAM: hypothetical protein NCL1_09529 [Trichonephila clavipes]